MTSKLWMGSDPSDDLQSQEQENAFGQKPPEASLNVSTGSSLGTSSGFTSSTFGSSLASVTVSSIMSQMAAFSAQTSGTTSSVSHSQSAAPMTNLTSASSSTTNSNAGSSSGNTASGSSNAAFTNADLSIAPTDFGQWHLVKGTPSGVDINVQKAWKDYSGKGITVGVVDQGVSRVSELTNAYDPAKGFDVLRRINDGNNKFGDEQHGTWVSGVIAAKNDGQGTTGVAYNSTITSFRLLGKPGESQYGFVSDLDTALRMQNRVQVSNNSWGFTSPLAANSIAPMINSALESTVRTGRNGLGTIMVFAAGNSRQQGDNTNYSPLTNSRFSIVAAACNPDGTGANFSTMGTNILVTAPGVNIIAPGLNNQYYQVSGTSFAAPIVSAVSALMLEANSKLGYRDVQEILVYSARQNDAGNSSWQINGAKNWNGGGLHVSNQYGFGLIDATAAVRLAESWGYTKPAPLTAFNESSFTFSNATALKSIGSNQTLTSSINVNRAMKIEHVEVQLNLTQPYSGDLTIRLISPNNTVSLLMDRPALGQSSTPYSPSFVLSSNFDWGESGMGNWTLQVTNAAGGRPGLFGGWSLKLSGDSNLSSTPFIFTDEYGKYTGVQNAARQVISNATGRSIINAAAVTSNNNINLNQDAVSQIANNVVKIAKGTLVDTAIAGDGDTVFTGNDLGNTLVGGRGKNYYIEGKGNDQLIGGKGSNVYTFGTGGGRDTIVNFKANAQDVSKDLIAFGASIKKTDVAIFMEKNDLVIRYNNNVNDMIRVQNYSNANNKVGQIQLSDKTLLNDTSINKVIQDMTAYATKNKVALTNINDVKNNANLMQLVSNAWRA